MDAKEEIRVITVTLSNAPYLSDEFRLALKKRLKTLNGG